MVVKPQTIHFQTLTECNGHCRYCPFDDIYLNGEMDHSVMSEQMYCDILEQLKAWKYKGKFAFLLHYEPTLDDRLPHFFELARQFLPGTSIEVVTNGLIPDSSILQCVDRVDLVLAGSRTLGSCTSRAGNARACPENADRYTFHQPCVLPRLSMNIAANGDFLLCCQDWRHEAVVGHYNDVIAARETQLSLMPAVQSLRLQICRDCAAGKTFEEITFPRSLEIL